MKSPDLEFSKKQKQCLKYVTKIQYISLAYTASMVSLMYLVMGNSQAMKTSWIEDMLSAIPGLTFLTVCKFKDISPTKRFPYGFHRIGSLGFLLSSVTLLGLGLYLFVSAVSKLISQEHPTIGMMTLFGIDLWQGWWMLMVLVWGAVPPLILGYLKLKPAQILHDKILFTDSKMNKADWMTSLATAFGVLGVGLGLWWMDAVAAIFITLDIIYDGFKYSRDACTDLMNRSPKNLEGKYIDLPEKCHDILKKLPWVKTARVRMYELGHIIYVEAFVVPTEEFVYKQELISKARKEILKIDWKIHDVSLTLLSEKELGSEFSYF